MLKEPKEPIDLTSKIEVVPHMTAKERKENARKSKWMALRKVRHRTKIKSDFYEMIELPEPDECGNLFEYKYQAPTSLDDLTLHKFLIIYARVGTIKGACKELGIWYSSIDMVRLRAPAFNEAMKEALEEFRCGLQEAARKRAMEGTIKTVYYKGKKVGEEREHSDRLMELMLSAHLPDFSRKEKGGKGGGGLTIKLAVITNPDKDQKKLGGTPIGDHATIHVDTEELPDSGVGLPDDDGES